MPAGPHPRLRARVNYLTERRPSRRKVEDSRAEDGAMDSLGTRLGRLFAVAIGSCFLSSTIGPAAAAQVRMPIWVYPFTGHTGKQV